MTTSMSNKKKITCRLLSDYDQPIPLSGEIIVMMHVGETSYIYDTIVAKIMDDCILGLDFMKINGSDGVVVLLAPL